MADIYAFGPGWDLPATAQSNVNKLIADYLVANPPAGGGGSGTLDAKVAPNGTDWNTVTTPGPYIVPSTAAAATMVNYPTRYAGVVKVWKSAGAGLTIQEVTAHTSATSAPEKFSRSVLTGTAAWCPWAVDAWAVDAIPTGTNLKTHRSAGAFQIPSTAVCDSLLDLPQDNGAPVSGVGHYECLMLRNTPRCTQRLTLEVGGKIRVWVRTTGTISTAPAWQETTAQAAPVAPPTAAVDADTADAGYRHEWLLNRAKARRGGVIGTGGVAAVSVRFDHWSDQFEAKVLPLLRKHQIPATLNLNADRQIAGTAPNTKPLAQVAEWALADGVEIANHGATHVDATTKERTVDEIVGGLKRLQDGLGPRVIVDAWHGHGSGVFKISDTDVWQYGNLDAGTGFDSTAGKLITKHHAFIEGKSSGFFQPLTGKPVQAASHMSIDVMGAEGGINAVEVAKSMKRGLTVYVHPGLLDEAGNMTTAQLDQFLGYLAAERAAGRIVVTTVSSMSLCDVRSTHREEILIAPDQAGSWSGTTGWSFTGTGATARITGTNTAGLMSQSVGLFVRYGWAMGSMVELVVTAKATGGQTAVLRLAAEDIGGTAPGTVLNAAREVTLPASGEQQTHRLFFTLPARRTTDNVKISLGRVSGGGIEIVGAPTVRPV